MLLPKRLLSISISKALPLQRQVFKACPLSILARHFSSELPTKNESGIVGAVPLRKGSATKRAIVKRRIDASQVTPVHDQVKTVISVCIAEGFDMTRLEIIVKPLFGKFKQLQEDVFYFTNDFVELFVFGDGCFVVWGKQADVYSTVNQFKKLVEPLLIGREKECESETLFFKEHNGETFYAGMEGETIILETAPGELTELQTIRSKLAFSNGLADSVKLAVLENSLEDHLERTRFIPVTLASGGKLPLGRADVLRLTGELLKFRADLNLHSELTDTPEMYWSEPHLEELYHRVSRVLDLRQRCHVINKKLDYANELAEIIRSHLSEQHGLKLEWGIIALIAVEVAFETLHWIID